MIPLSSTTWLLVTAYPSAEMKKPDPCAVMIRSGRWPGEPGKCGAPKRRENRSRGDCGPRSSKLTVTLVCTPITAGFTASTTSAKLAGAELGCAATDVGHRCGVGDCDVSTRAADTPASAPRTTASANVPARRSGRDAVAAG